MVIITTSEMILVLFASLSLIQAGDSFRLNNGQSNMPMLDMLDMMQQLMTGGGQFNRNFIKEIRTCMATFDPELPDIHEKNWQGIIDYWEMGGGPDDRWGQAPTGYSERNITVSSYKRMTVYEPCNFGSNIAYYHLINELCHRRTHGSKFNLGSEYINAIGKMGAALPVASSFMHVSNTNLGTQQDVGIIRILAYLLHQGIMEALPHRSTILSDLSPVPRPMTSLQIVDFIQKMYSTEPVKKWYNIFETIDMPDYYLGIAGPLLTMLHMNLNDNLVDRLIPSLVDSFGLPAEHQEFLTKDFLSELRRVLPNIDRKNNFRNNLLGNSIGAVAKLLHAFLWDEIRVFTSPILLEPIPNFIGSVLLPELNSKINSVTNYQYFYKDFQRGVNVYPGEQWCQPQYAHAKWHVQSALAVLDFMYAGDEMKRLLAQTQN